MISSKGLVSCWLNFNQLCIRIVHSGESLRQFNIDPYIGMDGWDSCKHQIANNKFQLIIGVPALLEFGTCSLEFN